MALGAGDASAGKADDILIWATEQEVSSADPYYNQIRENIIIFRNACDGLVYADPDSNDYHPLLAESYEWIDSLTLEFVLRQGVVFHDGKPFSAEDVAYTINHVVAEDSGVTARSTVEWMKSAEQIDDYTVRIHLHAPFPTALEYLSGQVPILPAGHYEDAPVDSEGRKQYGALLPICTGPYKVTGVVAGDSVDLEINENYFDGPRSKASIGKLRFRTIPDRQTQMAELLTGGVDWIWGVDKDTGEQLAKSGQVQAVQVPTMRIEFIQMDSAGRGGDNPFQDVRVRRAINHAINREAIAESLVGEAAEVIHSACYPSQFGCSDDVQKYEYDPDKARQLLAEAGYPDGFDFDFYAYRERQWTEAMIGDLQNVGIRSNLRFLQFITLRPMTRNAEAQLSHLSWGSFGINDVSAITSFFFKHSTDDQARDDQVKEWLEIADTSIDQDERREYYKRAQQRIAEQAYWVPLWTNARYYAFSNELNFTPHFDDIPRFYNATWK